MDFSNLDAVYQRSWALQAKEPEAIVGFFEHAAAAELQDKTVDKLFDLRRDPHTGAPLTLFRHSGIAVDAASQMVMKVTRASEALFRGLSAGLKKSISADPALADRLSKKLLQSQLLNVVAPAVFASGAVVGIIRDIVKTVTGIYELIKNFDQILKAVVDLIKAILNDEKAAFELGKLIGSKLGDEVKKLSKHGVIRFTYELGRLFGPMIVYAVLALTGVGALATAARIFKDLVKVLRQFPKIKKLLDALMELAEKAKRASGAVVASVKVAVAARRSGIAARHIKVFQKVAAAKGGLNRIIAVRFTNTKSTKWIERGYPAKPLAVKIKTNKRNGIVTRNADTTDKEVSDALNAGYYIVDELGVARNKAGKALDLPEKTDWPLQPGQVIDGKQKKPLVGDYDLHSVIDPAAPGRVIAKKTDNYGVPVKDATNPDVKRVARALNSQMDQRRVLHGAHDLYDDLPSAKPGVIVFHPDGKIQLFGKVSQMQAFFKSIGRVTAKDKYPSGPMPDVLPDNVTKIR